MAYIHPRQNKAWQPCLRCGRRMKLPGDYRNLPAILAKSSAQRRGLRCMNCGQTTCFKCSDNGAQCICGGNAWVALPYLEEATAFHAPAGSKAPEKRNESVS